MTGSFPLFTNLSKDLRTGDVTTEEKEEFIEKVKELDKDDEAHSLMYALIKVYYQENNSPNSFILPYGGRQLKPGIKFDLEAFPIPLRQILNKFLELHFKTREERENLQMERY